ncbi:MAG: hypothetical protein E7E98_08550 [Cutibacterium avidum]|nr:hypothetical protein [Cutibacterium avidum]
MTTIAVHDGENEGQALSRIARQIIAAKSDDIADFTRLGLMLGLLAPDKNARSGVVPACPFDADVSDMVPLDPGIPSRNAQLRRAA